MIEFVELSAKRHRGWPWPEDSWGLEPMFGADGWCRSCGVPRAPQSGSLVLRGRGLVAQGAWIPNWRFDAICLSQALAREIGTRFDVELLPVVWNGKASPGDATQVVVRSSEAPWFDPEELRAAAEARHGTAGDACPQCGVWRCLPLSHSMLPRLRISPSWASADIVASPEWFGDGKKAFRKILMRRELATILASASPKDIGIRELNPELVITPS